MDRQLILNSLPRRGGFWAEVAEKVSGSERPLEAIPEDAHWLAAVRACLLKHRGRFRLCVTRRPGALSRRLPEGGLENLLAQLAALEKGARWAALRGDFPAPGSLLFATVAEQVPRDALLVCSDLYSASGVLLGLDSLRLMEIQRRDRILGFLRSADPNVRRVMKNLDSFSRWCVRQPWAERDKVLVFSGSVFTAMGLTWTTDIDVLVVHLENFPFRGGKQQGRRKDFDVTVLRRDGTWLKNDSSVLRYQSDWLTTEWPALAGARDLFEVLENPRHHFFFMGIKLVSIDLTIQRHLRRSFPMVLTDAIMMKQLVGIDVLCQVCLPTLVVTQGCVQTYAGKREEVARVVVRLARLWYGERLPLSRVLESVRECPPRRECAHTGVRTSDADVTAVVAHHDRVARAIVRKRCRDSERVLFVGHLFPLPGRPPRSAALADPCGPWPRDRRYDCVVLPFTLGWFTDDLAGLCDAVCSVCAHRVVVLCLDARRLLEAFESSSNRAAEVRDDQEPLFGVYALDPLRRYRKAWGRVIVYFNGTTGVDKGSVQKVVSLGLLSREFRRHRFRLRGRYELARESQPPLQRAVSSHYHALVYEREAVPPSAAERRCCERPGHDPPKKTLRKPP